MRRYRHEIDNVRAHLRSLWAVIALQLGVILALWFGWSRAPEHLVVHIPPDLRSGSVQATTTVHAANVYAFAFYIFQQLNRWPQDGAEDYGRAIFRVSPYLTPRYRADLVADMELKGKRGELAYRVRGVQEVSGRGFEEARIDVLAPGVWIAHLDLELSESVKGMTVKHTAIRYPLRIVRHAVDPEVNPWGLALDGFAAQGPSRLDLPGAGDA
ncbi:MAG: TIGR03746 family integrating conjugative element protein [Gammaproteobacteria bacterium]|nr:TIGR03746 family integrating conjugative element protein [Gammaproteobacteria bacterium]